MEETVVASVDIHLDPHEEKSSMVDKERSDLEATSSAVPLLDHTYYRCKFKWLGSPLRSSHGAGEVGLSHGGNSLERPGDTGSLSSPSESGEPSTTNAGPVTLGQQSGSVVYPMTGGISQHPFVEGSGAHYAVGRKEPSGAKGSLPSGPPGRGGELSVPELSRQQRMVPSPLNIQLDHGSPEPPRNRSLCLNRECQITKVPFTSA